MNKICIAVDIGASSGRIIAGTLQENRIDIKEIHRFKNCIMIEEIKTYCLETEQPVPDTPGEISRCIFESLAFQYKEVLMQLREIQRQEINRIHVIGGGAQNKFLNQLCANFTDCEVYAGPIEATAIGNLVVQFITLKEINSVENAREIILKSFVVERYKPVFSSAIEENWNKFKALI